MQRIAELCEANSASLQRLDSAFAAQLHWSNGSHGAIAELTAPKWLAAGGGDLAGLTIEQSGDLITISPAGSAHATAVVHRYNTLVVGGPLQQTQIASEMYVTAQQQVAQQIAQQISQWISTVPAGVRWISVWKS